METKAIEMFSYKPADGVSLEDALAKDAEIKEAFVVKQPGFVDRYTTVTEDGTVYVFIHWDSMEHVEASQAKAMQDPLMGEYTSMMDQSTLAFSNLTVKH